MEMEMLKGETIQDFRGYDHMDNHGYIHVWT